MKLLAATTLLVSMPGMLELKLFTAFTTVVEVGVSVLVMLILEPKLWMDFFWVLECRVGFFTVFAMVILLVGVLEVELVLLVWRLSLLLFILLELFILLLTTELF